MLTGRYRKGQATNSRRAGFGFRHMSDERLLDVVEQFIPVAEEAGIKMSHMAVAFAITHPGVTSAITGPRTLDHLQDLLDGVMDKIDFVVRSGTDVSPLNMDYTPPALTQPDRLRRPADSRSAA